RLGRRHVAGPAAALRLGRQRVAGPAAALRLGRQRVAGPAVVPRLGLLRVAGLAAGPRAGRRGAAALLAPRRSGFVAEEPALTVARESAAPVLARLPVSEHALPLVARPVPLVSVVVAGLVDGIPAR